MVATFVNYAGMAQLAEEPNSELPAIMAGNKSNFYVPANVLKLHKLQPAKGDSWMKVYNATTEVKNAIVRLNDIRWQAANANEAGVWVLNNFGMLSENGEAITNEIEKPTGVDVWSAFGMGKKAKELNDAFGIAFTTYNFIFSVDKYVGKIFISGNAAMTVNEAFAIAKTGINATIAASKK